MEACLRAVEGGLTRATVTDGRVPHALLLEIFTNAGIGTMVTQDGLVRLGSRVFSAEEGIPQHEYANGEFEPGPTRRAPEPHDPRPPRSTTRRTLMSSDVMVTAELTGPAPQGSAACSRRTGGR